MPPVVEKLGAAAADTSVRTGADTDRCLVCLGAGLLRDGYDDEPPHDDRLRWVACEACGGSGEVIRGRNGDDWNEPCGACDGTGRDCVGVSPVAINDLDQMSL